MKHPKTRKPCGNPSTYVTGIGKRKEGWCDEHARSLIASGYNVRKLNPPNEKVSDAAH